MLNDFIQEISRLLAGDSCCQEDAIRLIDIHLRLAVIAKIRRTAPSLSFEEVADAYQEVLLGVWRIAASSHYDPKKPLLPLLLTIAQRKAVDRLRMHSPGGFDYDALFDAVSARLVDSTIGEAWRAVAAQEDGRRMMTLIREAVAKLPEHQRRVAAVVIDHFPDVPSHKELCDEVRKGSGEVISSIAVKRAWQEARKKIRELLIREGYLENGPHA